MTDVEQFLADLEAKAKAAEKNWEKKYSEESDEVIRQLEASMNFIDSASPAAVLRLVGMVRWLATAAANNGWHGVGVSPEQMREAARKAVEEEACPKN